MISNENLGGLMGAPAVGANDERIGTVAQVFVDPTTGAPNWVTVHTGLFGRHETFVPLDEATWDREVLHVPYEKDLVKDAPRIDTEDALSPQAEEGLYRYYGIGDSAAGEDDGEEQEATDDPAPAGESMRLRKYQVTEQQEISVPVTHEEVRLEPEPPADAADAEEEPRKGSKHKGRHRA